ncbi:hypothetical protein [Zavarzinia sp.]|uniref:hypothetical protein n=1 Tax=Zavarzinia sp. TaxID=2027920 RepID=UPI003BB7F6AB
MALFGKLALPRVPTLRPPDAEILPQARELSAAPDPSCHRVNLRPAEPSLQSGPNGKRPPSRDGLLIKHLSVFEYLAAGAGIEAGTAHSPSGPIAVLRRDGEE